MDLTEPDYLDIIAKKTASLLRACGLFGATFAGAPPQLVNRIAQYGHHLGMAFQIADDMLDLLGSEEEMGKTVGRDLDRGELTLPFIRFLDTASATARAEMVAALDDAQPSSIQQILRLLRESDALAYCDRLARSYTERATSALEALPPSEARDCLAAIAEFVLSRRH
jgi:geranylgeranyl pyrophosphate synthase